LVDPKGYETDGSIGQLVDGIVRGKVLAWVADADDGSFGLDPASPNDGCSVGLYFAGQSEPIMVRLGGEGEGGVYGIVSGHPEVFVAPIVLRELAKRLYVSQASLRVDPARLESVKVVHKGQPVTAASPAELREAAGALYPDRAVALGAPGVGAVDVEITMALAEGGPPKRVACGVEYTTATGRWRRCAASDVKATFEVRPALVDAFLQSGRAADASASRP
jgi:hypothetical protein